jgi:hypothetical protein
MPPAQQQQSATVPLTGVDDARTQLTSTTPSVPITVHPLVLLNISDDAARIQSNIQKAAAVNSKPGYGDPNCSKAGFTRVPFGIVMGTSGHETSAHTCVDFVCLRNDATGVYELDWAMARKRVDLCRQVLASYDVIGWYTTGTGLDSQLVTVVHETFLTKQKPSLESSNVCPKPIVLVVNTNPAAGSRGVPLVVFESKPSTESGKPAAAAAVASAGDSSNASLLTRVEYQFESEVTERIGVQQAADSSSTGPGTNWVGPAADRFGGAVGSLNRRISVITDYLKAVHEGKVAPDAELLRRIKQCATKLPRPEDALELRALLGEGVQDALTTSTVALMTKGTLGFAQLLEDTSTGLENEAKMYRN